MTREEALKILKARDNGVSLHKFELALEYIIELLDSKPQELEESIALVNEYNLRPYRDGDAWCILLGKNIQSGICGFGYTIIETYLDFLKSYKEYNHPISELIAQISSSQGLDEANQMLDEKVKERTGMTLDEHKKKQQEGIKTAEAIVWLTSHGWSCVAPNHFNLGLDEAAEALADEHGFVKRPSCKPAKYSYQSVRNVFIEAAIAGAKWMAGQGVTKECIVGVATKEIVCTFTEETLDKLGVCPSDKVVVQIRKK